MASPKSIKQIVNDAKSAAQLNVDFEREYGRKPNSNEGNDLTNLWLKKTNNSTSVSTGTSAVTSTATDATAGSNSFIGGFTDALKGTVNFANKGIELGTSFIQELYKTQLGSGAESDTTLKILDIVKRGISTGTVTKLIETAGDEILDQLKQQSAIYTSINTKIGISGELSKALSDDMIAAEAEAKRYGFTLQNLAGFYSNMSEYSGKFALINKNTLLEAAPVAAQLGKTMEELASTISTFEDVGFGADKTLKSMGEAGVRAVSLGLNAQKVTKGMEENIGKLNQYGFKNGIQGLERMVQKSIEFKISMDTVASIAEKVMNPDGAVDLAANLQVLGGAFGSFGDPLKMMYEATNNMEGLQDSLIGAAKGLATYNQEQGKYEITGINLRKAREMATALGISDYKQLANAAVAAQERASAAAALMSSGLNMEEKDREFLTNLGRMQDGEMKIVIPESLQEKMGKQSEISMEKLTKEQRDTLLANKKYFEDMNPQKMAMAQLTEMEKMGRSMDVVATWAKIQAANFIKGGVNEGLGKQMAKMRDEINEFTPKADVKIAMKEGAKRGRDLKEGNLGEAASKMQESLVKTFDYDMKKGGKNQEPPVQKYEHQINIRTDNPSDYFREVIKKDPSIAFPSSNPKNWTAFDVAKRKGK